jgi:hypothetical protein
VEQLQQGALLLVELFGTSPEALLVMLQVRAAALLAFMALDMVLLRQAVLVAVA